jgi:predicted nucleotidyltransferase
MKTGAQFLTPRSAAERETEKLRRLLSDLKPPSNTSVIAFGSLARKEWTSGSDVDWTLMVDGPADMSHLEFAKDVGDLLKREKYVEPGTTGIFGAISSSYEMVHYIGGIEDSNQNITRRILLLLESVPLTDASTHERVIRAVLNRYILGDPPATTPTKFRVPLFLFNDIVRYWRTMAVDYAAKKWQQSNEKWALRNIKLRMSRKLLFVKGMLVCFLCDEEFAGKPVGSDRDVVLAELLTVCYDFCRQPAIELLARAVSRCATECVGKDIFDPYNKFLQTMNDPAKRAKLKTLDFDDSDDPLFMAERQNSRTFGASLEEFFFDSHRRLGELTRRYGVF